MAIPVSEAQRTPEGARDRLHKRLEEAIRLYEQQVVASSGHEVAVAAASFTLQMTYRDATEEYTVNIGKFTGIRC